MSGYAGYTPALDQPFTRSDVAAARLPAARLAGVRRLPLWQGDVMLVVAAAILALGFAAPYACTRLQILLTIILVIHRNPVWIPALMLLQFTPTDFKGGYGAGMDVQYERFEGLTVYVLGFPLTPNFTLVLAMVVRAVLDIVGYPLRFRGVLPSVLLVPITLAVLVSAYNSVVLGYFEHLPGWSAPLRTSLLSLAVWYGASVATDWDQYRRVLLHRVSLMAAGFLAVTFASALVNSQYCFLIPFGASSSYAFLTARDMQGWLRRPFGAMMLSLNVLNYFLGKRASEQVVEATKSVGGGVVTQTTHAVMAALPLMLMAVRPRIVSPRNQRLASILAPALFAAYLAAPFLVATLTRGVDVEVRDKTAKTFSERAAYKLIFERSSIWRGQIDLISRAPFVFVPPSRESKWITASGEEFRFRASAHNMVLAHLASEGWFSGGINLAVVFVAFSAAVRLWMLQRNSFCGILSTTFIIGMMWDGFAIAHCMEGAAAFALLTTGGACCVAASRSWEPAMQRPEPMPLPARQT